MGKGETHDLSWTIGEFLEHLYLEHLDEEHDWET
jgi:hypothetical protein